jgi:hypothetical protein
MDSYSDRIVPSFNVCVTLINPSGINKRNSCRQLLTLIRAAMIHATVTGLDKDESADEGG